MTNSPIVINNTTIPTTAELRYLLQLQRAAHAEYFAGPPSDVISETDQPVLHYIWNKFYPLLVRPTGWNITTRFNLLVQTRLSQYRQVTNIDYRTQYDDMLLTALQDGVYPNAQFN